MPTPVSANTRIAASRSDVGPASAELAQWLRWTVLGLLVSVAAVLAWRRLSGAVVSPPGAPLLLAVGAAAAAVAAAVRLRAAAAPQSPAVCRLFTWLPLPALAVLGAAMTFRATPWAALAGFWGLLMAEECWAVRQCSRRHGQSPWHPNCEGAIGPVTALGGASTARGASGAGEAAVSDRARVHAPHAVPPVPVLGVDEAADDAVTQRLTRATAADGSDVLGGLLRLQFAAGQRTASAHVAFCPPFPRTPGWNVAQREGPAARVKTTQLQPYGARIEVKIAAPADVATRVVLQFSARWSAENGLT